MKELLSTYLAKRADRYGIPVPKTSFIADQTIHEISTPNSWIEYLHTVPLTHGTESDLQQAVRQKKRENWEWWLTKIILPGIGALTGLITAAIALVLALKK